jgi:hypothetical protein
MARAAACTMRSCEASLAAVRMLVCVFRMMRIIRFQRQHRRGRVGDRDVVVAVHLLHAFAPAAVSARAHGQPHQQLHALGAGFLDQFMDAELRGPFRVALQALQELQVERLVDEAGAFAVELVATGRQRQSPPRVLLAVPGRMASPTALPRA